ncbi:TPA: Dr family adhesin structural subunit DaaE [Escherichia coli]
MKKLAIMAAASMIFTVGSAQATFQASGTTGITTLTVTEECRVQVGNVTATLARSKLKDDTAIGVIGVTALGCNGLQTALQAEPDNYDATNLYMTSRNHDKLNVKLKATDGSSWTYGNGVFYKTEGGSWGGLVGISVDGNQTDKPTGEYTLNLTGGYWTN